MAKKDFDLVVKTRDEVLFRGTASSLSSKNKKGKFDVLAEHANFITLIEQTLQIRQKGGGLKEIEVDMGLVRVLKDKVEVFLGIKNIFSKSELESAPKKKS